MDKKRTLRDYKNKVLTTLVLGLIFIVTSVFFIPLATNDFGEFLPTSLEAIIFYVTLAIGIVFLLLFIIFLVIYIHHYRTSK